MGETVSGDIKEQVIDLIARQLGQDKANITPEKTIQGDLGADSLDVVELIMKFEEEFDVTVPDEEAEKMKTVGDIVSYIEANR